MGSFLQRIVSAIRGGASGNGAGDASGDRVYLGAFGKHPGWDDHIDDPGIDSEHLAELKRSLYINGIGGNIDSGAWHQLESDKIALPFDHQFVQLRGPNDVLVGRLWASRDGKGRSRYPMAVVAHCRRMPLQRAAAEVFPQLETVREKCVAAADAAGVRSALDSTRQAMRDQLHGTLSGAAAGAQCDSDWRTPIIAHADQRTDKCDGPRGLLSVLYKVENEMNSYWRDEAMGIRPHLRSTTLLGSQPAPPAPQPLRVPQPVPDPVESMCHWAAALLSLLDDSTPILIVRAMGGDWLDLIVGEPTASQLYCLKASSHSMPYTTRIPYTLDAGFIDRAARFLGFDDAGVAGLLNPPASVGATK